MWYFSCVWQVSVLNPRKPIYQADTLPSYCKYIYEMSCTVANKLADRFFCCGPV